MEISKNPNKMGGIKISKAFCNLKIINGIDISLNEFDRLSKFVER